MGLCCPESKEKKAVSQQFKQSICKIKSKKGLKGLGFFVKTQHPGNSNTMNLLITSNKLINEDDLTNGNNIQLYLKNSNTKIKLYIDNKRKFYIDDQYQISIIELFENDELKNISFLNAGFFLSHPFFNIFDKIFFLCFNNDSNNTIIDQYIAGNINNYIDINNIFSFSTDINKNMSEAIGCPILLSSNNEVIGINITEQDGNNKGILIYNSIDNFYKKYFIIKVIFQDTDFNIQYYILAFNYFMFGELISSFYSQTNIIFDDKITFFFNNDEIPCYSTELLSFYNIEDGSRIFFQRKQYLKGHIANILFNFSNGYKRVMQTYGNMTKMELILKFCIINRKLYGEVIRNYKFIDEGIQIIPNTEIMEKLSKRDNILIEVLEM